MDEELMLHRDHNIIISAAEVSEDRMSHRTEIFRIHYGVEIIYISPEGVVSAPSCPSSLVIVSLTRADEGHTQRKGTASVFLQVGDWMYPLVAGSTPALRTVDGAYLFPDNNTKQPGSVVCLKLPERLAERKRSRFERLIESFTALELQRDHSRHNRQGHKNPPQYGTCKLSEIKASSNSDNIVTGAEWIAWGIEKTAEKVGDLIRVGSEKLREQIPPESTECNVDPGMQMAMAVARKTAEGVADFTGFMVAALGEATMFVGRQLAPHVRRQGEKYLPEHMSRTDPWTGKSELDDLAEKTASGIKGFCTVYAALDSAARSMGRSLANETVQVMQHKYGAQVGQLTENAVYTAGSALQCVYNRKCLGAKAVAKRVARDTGKAVVEDINKSPQHTSSYCGSFYKL
ncbi:spartin [Aplysia californica]|uniref:Spartin n=1 Tax=Aplysia californica TaxID=6500 RepID=A0ABM0K1F2_APLCA|nr:spartin [Aplysia californica]XP_005106505.1 spartin [Aplysia californica]XP_035827801.1 spartin [Aplysia californica]